MVGPRRAATWGLMLFAACIGALGIRRVDPLVRDERLRIPLDRIADTVHVPPLILIVMILSIPAGFASSVVSVSSRAVLLARAPRRRPWPGDRDAVA